MYYIRKKIEVHRKIGPGRRGRIVTRVNVVAASLTHTRVVFRYFLNSGKVGHIGLATFNAKKGLWKADLDVAENGVMVPPVALLAGAL